MEKLHFLHPQHLLFSGICSDVQCQYSFAHKLWQIQYIISAPTVFSFAVDVVELMPHSLKICLEHVLVTFDWPLALSIIPCILNGRVEIALSGVYPTYALNAHTSTTKLEGSLVQCLIFYCEFNLTLAIISARYPSWGLYCSANQLAESNWKSLCLVMDTEWFSCNKEFS